MPEAKQIYLPHSHMLPSQNFKKQEQCTFVVRVSEGRITYCDSLSA